MRKSIFLRLRATAAAKIAPRGTRRGRPRRSARHGGRMRRRARPDQPRAGQRAGQVVLRRLEIAERRRRPRVLQARHRGRRRLRRGPERALHLDLRPAGVAHSLGDHGKHAQRAPRLRAHQGDRRQGQRVRRRRTKPPTTGRSSPATRSRATSTSGASTTRRPAKSSTSSSRTRAIAPGTQREYFRVDWSKNLVTDSYDFDTLSLSSASSAASNTTRWPTPCSTRRTPTRRISSRRRAISTSPTRPTPRRRSSISRGSRRASSSSRPACSPAISRAAPSRGAIAGPSRSPSASRTASVARATTSRSITMVCVSRCWEASISTTAAATRATTASSIATGCAFSRATTSGSEATTTPIPTR